MTRIEIRNLETILGKIEALQNRTNDPKARERLGTAKSELLLLLTEAEREQEKGAKP